MDGAKPAAAAGGKHGLDEALLQIVHQHHHQALRQRQQTERAKKDALRSAVRVADLLVDTVDGGVQELFVNEKRIELEARALLGTIARYRKQTDQWLAATSAINSVLKCGYLFLGTSSISNGALLPKITSVEISEEFCDVRGVGGNLGEE
ncbi:hypothetical protein ACP70R_028502 [Stipagrostis hirtigluma subsp. patula]